MNKKEFIDQLAEDAELSNAQSASVFQAVFDNLKALLVAGDSLSVPGFGSFGTKVRAARKGRNPSTGAEMDIPEAIVAFFKAGSVLKAAVNVKKESD